MTRALLLGVVLALLGAGVAAAKASPDELLTHPEAMAMLRERAHKPIVRHCNRIARRHIRCVFDYRSTGIDKWTQESVAPDGTATVVEEGEGPVCGTLRYRADIGRTGVRLELLEVVSITEGACPA